MWGNPATSNYKRLTATGQVAKGQHQLSGLLVASGTPTLKIYDGIDNTGQILVNSMVCAAATPYPVPAKCNVGIYVEITNAGDVTFFYD